MKLRSARIMRWALGGILLTAGPAAGQARRGIRDPRQNRRLASAQVQGTIHSLQPGIVRVISDENDRWLVQVTRETRVKVQGRTDMRVLQPGRFVRFYAEFDRRGTAQGPVAELTVFDPDEGIRPGMVEAPHDDSEAASADETRAAPNGRGEPPRPRDSARRQRSRDRRDSRQRDQQQVPEIRRLFVVGQIRGFREGVLSVLVGHGKAVTVDVDESARVMIETRDYGVARGGDRIRLKGRFVGPGKLSAREIEIELASLTETSSQPGEPETPPGTSALPPPDGGTTPRE